MQHFGFEKRQNYRKKGGRKLLPNSPHEHIVVGTNEGQFHHKPDVRVITGGYNPPVHCTDSSG